MKTCVCLWYLAHFFLEWQMLYTKVVEKIKTHILCSITFFLVESPVVFESFKNIVEPDRPQMTMWRMCIACWIPKTTDTHSEFLVLCCSTTTVVQTRLSATLYIHCVSCLNQVCSPQFKRSLFVKEVLIARRYVKVTECGLPRDRVKVQL